MFLGVSLRDRVGWMGLEQRQRVCILAWFWCVLMLSMVNSPQPEHWSIHRGLQSWLHVTAKYKITQMLGLIWNQQNQNPWRWVCSQNPCLCLHKLGNTSCPTSPSPIHTENSEQREGTISQDCFSCSPYDSLCWHDQHPVPAQGMLLTIMGHSPSSQMEHHQPSSKVYKTSLQ